MFGRQRKADPGPSGYERPPDMRNCAIRLILAAITVVVLASCEEGDAPSGTPGSAALSIHGRIESGASILAH